VTLDLDATSYCDHAGLWGRELAAWMPESLFDAHVHLGPPEVMGEISPQRRRVPLCTFTHLRLDQARAWHAQLFPGRRVTGTIAFPFPLREVDLAGANRYMVEVMRAAPDVRGFLLAHPTDVTPTLAAWDCSITRPSTWTCRRRPCRRSTSARWSIGRCGGACCLAPICLSA